jgi:flagellar hook-length control protein FliK
MAPVVGTAAGMQGSGAAVTPDYSALAHRLAEATAQRMFTDFRLGNSRLRLQLEPQSLGRVEIDMSMSGGTFEATIFAHQGPTRDLLMDGLGRLRETLVHLGMNVADLSVVGSSAGQSDGKSTGQRGKEPVPARRQAAAGGVDILTGQEVRRASTGSLDLWA